MLDENPLDRKCLGGESLYQKDFETIYDSLDPISQGAFCSVRRIFIEREFFATAYASLMWSKDNDGTNEKIPGAIIGVRKTLLGRRPEYAPWASWKEQQNFAHVAEMESPLPYPRFQTSTNLPLLEYALTHEVGHLLDFANKLNKESATVDCPYENITSDEDYYQQCKPEFNEGTWGRIDWVNSVQIQPAKDFDLRSKLCYYDCDTLLNPEQDAVTLYTGFSKSSFATTYGATNVADDFAEAWATHWVVNTKHSNVITRGSADISTSLEEIYHSERFKTKREFLEKFVKGPVRYP